MTTTPTSSNQPSLDHQPFEAIISHLTKLWIVTGLVSSMVAVGVAFLVGKTGANVLSQILVAIACGTLTAFALAPWRHVQALMNRAHLFQSVAELIHDLQTGDRDESLRELCTRKDEVGQLCRAVDALLGTFVSQRVRTHSLRRTMHEQIRRETSRATAALVREATTDSLTGLGNRRALEQFLDHVQMEAPTKPEQRMAAMVIDVDHFKQLNDTAGHRQGDECLKFIGTILQASTRREDCALRFGGDEFLVLFLDRTQAEMRAVADRVITLLKQMPWPTGAGQPPTLSIGMAEAAMHEIAEFDELVAEADAAMYRAKKFRGSSVGTAWGAGAVADDASDTAAA